MENLKTNTINHLRKGNVQNAFDMLNNHIERYSNIGKSVVVLESSFNSLGYKKIDGTIDLEESEREMRKIIGSLIELCAIIQKEDLIVIPTPDIPEKHIAYFLIKRAEKSRQKKDYQNAIKDLLEAARQQPNNIAIQNDLAMNHRLAGNYSKALDLFDNIKDKRPNDVLCLNELAICQRELDRYTGALETLNRGLLIQPENNHFHSNKFFIHLFFTLNKNEAIAVRDNYERNFGRKLIIKPKLQDLYNQFLEYFEDIHNVSVHITLFNCYIEECQKKRAFNTAKNLLDRRINIKFD